MLQKIEVYYENGRFRWHIGLMDGMVYLFIYYIKYNSNFFRIVLDRSNICIGSPLKETIINGHNSLYRRLGTKPIETQYSVLYYADTLLQFSIIHIILLLLTDHINRLLRPVKFVLLSY